jgi:NADH-quinone oxidoreductase subunit J
MTLPFFILAAFTLAGGIGAMSLRNLVHCALCLVVALAGLAGLYLQLGAQFVGLAQILVYIGAVAILIVFAVLLTRGSEPAGQRAVSSYPVIGIGIAVAVFSGLVACIGASAILSKGAKAKVEIAADATVREIGTRLMTDYVLPLEVIGLLLTAAMIGAVIVAMNEKR